MSTEHHFRIADAENYGVPAAVLLYNMRFWLDKNKANNHNAKDNRYWTYNSLDAFAKLFPYFTKRQIEGILKKLEKAGLLLKARHSKNKFNQTTWYSLNQPEYEIDPSDKETAKTPLEAPSLSISPNGDMEKTKRGNGHHQTVKCLTDNNQQIKSTTTTAKPKKIDFDTFALCLIQTLNDMTKEGGWIPADMPQPKAAWTKSKANSLYSKFKDPDPADCAVIVLNDWVRIHSMSMSAHKGTTTQTGTGK